MSRSCFKCSRFPNCPFLRGIDRDGEDEMDELIVIEYGNYCKDFLNNE